MRKIDAMLILALGCAAVAGCKKEPPTASALPPAAVGTPAPKTPAPVVPPVVTQTPLTAGTGSGSGGPAAPNPPPATGAVPAPGTSVPLIPEPVVSATPGSATVSRSEADATRLLDDAQTDLAAGKLSEARVKIKKVSEMERLSSNVKLRAKKMEEAARSLGGSVSPGGTTPSTTQSTEDRNK